MHLWMFAYAFRSCKKGIDKILCSRYLEENQNPFHSSFFSSYILFHTTSVLETFLLQQATINRQNAIIMPHAPFRVNLDSIVA